MEQPAEIDASNTLRCQQVAHPDLQIRPLRPIWSWQLKYVEVTHKIPWLQLNILLEWSYDLRTLLTPPRAQGGTKELPRCTVSLLVWFVTYATV